MKKIRPDLALFALIIGLANPKSSLANQGSRTFSDYHVRKITDQLQTNHAHTASFLRSSPDSERHKFDAPDHDVSEATSPSDYFWLEGPVTELEGLNPTNVLSNPLQERDQLTHELIRRACKLDRGCQRKDRLNNTYLTHCARYKLDSLLSNQILMSIMHRSSSECENILDEFIQLDQMISQFDILFRNLLTRYNCHNGYSVKWTCEDCKRAYKDWLCATSLPYYMNGERIKPCISFCERVEQRCPYLHPITKEQYGGQPVFICRDPNIPFIPSITPDIPFSEPAKCYDLCHLSENITELLNDSLSKYEFGNCPEKSSIAEEVRSDSSYCDLDRLEQSGILRGKSNFSAADHSEDVAGGLPNGMVDLSEEAGSKKTASERNLDEDGLSVDQHVHIKKLTELREVLTVYKNQPKTHKFGHHIEHR